MFVIEDDTFEDVNDYYVVSLLPVLCSFFGTLVEKCRETSQKKVFFLSREGFFLAEAFTEFCRLRGLDHTGIPVMCSRAFLAKCALDEETIVELSRADYDGTVSSFFQDRLAVHHQELLDIGFSPSALGSVLETPRDAGRAKFFLSEYLSLRGDAIVERRQLYLDYLRSKGDWNEKTIVADVGYSGTLQRYLSRLSKADIKGCYIITSKASKPKKHISAVFPDVANFGEGHPLLDSSLILEVLMSANCGQCEDIRRDTNGDFAFAFGPRGRSQYAHAVLEMGHQYLLKTLASFKHIDPKVFVEEAFKNQAYTLLKNVLTFRNLTPKLIQHIGDVDDRISGIGFITPWKFLGPLDPTHAQSA